MSKYLKLFETTSEYEAYMGGGRKLPNVSLIEETNKVEYSPYIPEMYIIYKASEKLNVTWSNETATFGATIKSHTFENGVGTIEFNDNVTKIGNKAFDGCNELTSIIIPNSVKTISGGTYEGAFSNSGLITITISDGVTSIGNRAFYGCSNLTSITIPNSVTSIGNEILSACDGLINVVVESGNTKYDSRDNCNAIIETATNTLIAGCKNTTIPNSVTSIGKSAFKCYGGLKGIMIPNSVTSIGRDAFFNCYNLRSITIPSSVTSIGENAFDCGSNLTSVTVEASTPPTLGYRGFGSSFYGGIYVPAESVDTYKSASGWSTYASRIRAITTT